MSSQSRKVSRKNPTKAEVIEKSKRINDVKIAKTESEYLFVLHCNGSDKRECKEKLMVPANALRTMQILHETIGQVDWRISLGNTATQHKAAFAQCTDCWIDFLCSKGEISDDDLSKIDPSGKFSDRIRAKIAENGAK